MVKYCYRRLAELSRKLDDEGLSEDEAKEFKAILRKNEEYVDSILRLETLIRAAEIVKDTKWYKFLKYMLNELEQDPHRTKVKS